MKRIIAAVLALVVVLSLFPALALAESTKLPGGYIEDNTYYNEDAGLKFKCPDGWKFDTAEQIAKANGITVEDLNNADAVKKLMESGNDISLVNVSDSGSGIPGTITMTCKKLDAETAASVKELGEDVFLDQSLEVSDQSFSQSGVSVENMQIIKHSFLGKETSMMEFTIRFMLFITKKVNLVVFLRNDTLYTIAVVSDGKGLEYLDMFEAI